MHQMNQDQINIKLYLLSSATSSTTTKILNAIRAKALANGYKKASPVATMAKEMVT
jgi:hypothetical protein